MSRESFTDNEISESISKAKTKKSVESLRDQPADVDNPNIVAYTINGKVEPANSKKAYAKKEGNNYYVKTNGGQLLDPRGLYSTDLNKRIGDQSIWSWQKVGVKVYEYYLAYLTKGNKSHYHNASREMM